MNTDGGNAFAEIFSEIKEYLDIDFSSYKENTIMRRIKYRMSMNDIHLFKDYCKLVKDSKKEKTELCKDILVKVTNFFRDRQAFDSLYTSVIPNIFKNNRNGIIRVWSAGCSTGEEAYSLAILIREYMDNNNFNNQVKIFATDLECDVLKFAREGKYPKSIAFDIDEHLLKKYFIYSENCYEVKESIRKMIVFAKHNLLNDPTFTGLDLLVCRNVFIYFKPETQKEVLRKFHYSIKNGGYLFMGKSESIGDINDIFSIVKNNNKIYKCRKKESVGYWTKFNTINNLQINENELLTYSFLNYEEILLKSKMKNNGYNNCMDKKTYLFIDKINKLKNELQKNKKELQATIEELEASNEELQSMNEELIVSNEEQIQINSQLEESKKQLSDVYYNAPVAYMIFNLDGKIISVNSAFCKLIGEEQQFIINEDISKFLSGKSIDEYNKFLNSINEDIKYLTPIELIFKNRITNQRVFTEVNFNHHIKEDGWEIRATIFDVTVAKIAINNLEMDEERYRAVFEISEEVLWEYDISSKTMVYSSKYNNEFSGDTIILNYKESVLKKHKIHNEDISDFINFCDELATGKKHIKLEIRSKTKDEDYKWFLIQGTTVFNDEGIPLKVIGKTSNIDDTKKEQEKLKKLATLDPLTKLLNKSVTKSYIEDYLKNEGINGHHGFVIIDIDNFKAVNDNLGHLFGDVVLTEISSKILKLVSKKDIVGRVGGDEFVVLLKNCDDFDEINEKAENICGAFKNIYTGENKKIKVSSSIGISLYPKDGETYDELFRKADIALYSVKNNGKDNFKRYDENKNLNIQNVELHNHEDAEYCNIDRERIDNTIVANVIELLFEGKDTNSSINMVLSMLGKYYNVSQVCVIEELQNKKNTIASYTWRSDKITIKSENVKSILTEKIDNYKELFNSDGVFCCNDVSIIKDKNEFIYNYIVSEGVKSTIQCSILDEGIYKGFIGMFDCNCDRYWTNNEISTFTLIAKTLGAYLIKLRSRQQIHEYEYVDKLTGAWNLNKFILEANEFLKKPRKEKYALLYSDIENFKYFNATYGYSEGDRILIDFTEILDSLINTNEIYTRAVADKFIILLNYYNEKELIYRLKHFYNEFNSIYKNKTDCYKLSVTSGICLVEAEDKNIISIIDRANIARKSIKGSHKSTYVFYNNEIEKRIAKENAIQQIMEYALENNEFIVYYQPKVKLEDKSIIGAEALIRWQRPGEGIISPCDFIPLFEKNGFIIDIDFYIFEQVCKQLRKWIDNNQKFITISSNFSRAHLKKSDFISRLKSITEKYNIPTNLLEIEITESAFINNAEVLVRIIKELKELGFIISMDDFGTGYSALNLLKELPVDVLKLDKDFFKSSETSDREKIIISNVINMAKELNITVISEGVETIEQANFLNEIGCDMAQGYLFAKPMPIQDFEKLLFK